MKTSSFPTAQWALREIGMFFAGVLFLLGAYAWKLSLPAGLIAGLKALSSQTSQQFLMSSAVMILAIMIRKYFWRTVRFALQ